MEKREKILVSLMIAALGYGAFELFYSPSPRETATNAVAEVDSARILQESISNTISEAELNDNETYVLNIAASRWVNNPFYEWPAGEDTLAVDMPDEEWEPMHYSGYLEMGRTRMAVINGLEYMTGEVLQGGKFVVLNITPEKVVVQSLKSLSEVTIPYQDKFFVD